MGGCCCKKKVAPAPDRRPREEIPVIDLRIFSFVTHRPEEFPRKDKVRAFAPAELRPRCS